MEYKEKLKIVTDFADTFYHGRDVMELTYQEFVDKYGDEYKHSIQGLNGALLYYSFVKDKIRDKIKEVTYAE